MNVREGFRRFGAGEMAQFLSIALSSLAEALGWLQDGIDRRYFRAEDCAGAFDLGEASDRTTKALHTSLRPFLRRNRPRATTPPAPGKRTEVDG
jgi:four helix bundle protein